MDDAASSAEREAVDEVLDGYRAAVVRSNEIAAAREDLNRPGARPLRETPPPTMRWILVYMIEGTARHAGHADIPREQLDGSTGR